MYKQLLIIMLIFTAAIYSTCSAQQWVSTYGGPLLGENFGENQAVDIALCDSGKTCVTGYCEYGATSAMCTIKYGAAGDTQWVAIYQGPGNGENKAYAISVDDAGNIYVTGFSAQIQGQAMTTIKYNSDGTQQWVVTYIGTTQNGENKAYAITIDKFSNVYVTGYGTNNGHGKDMITIKYNSAGTQQWVGKYDSQSHNTDIAYSITLTSSDDIVITGFSQAGSDSTTDDYTTVKYRNIDGHEMWVKNYNGTGNGEDIAKRVLSDSTGLIYVTGYSKGSNSSFDMATIKYDAGGYELWVRRYDTSSVNNEMANSMALDGNGGVIVSGSSRISTGIWSENFVTLRYGPSGNLIWSNNSLYGSGNKDVAYSLAVSQQFNTVYVTGSSRTDTTQASTDMLTIAYSLDSGQYIQETRFNSPTNNSDVACDITVDSINNVYITGYTSFAGGFDLMGAPSAIVTLKYDKNTFIKISKVKNVPKGFILHQNYPNPFNPVTTIKFEIIKSAFVSLTVYNILGQKVVVLVNEFMKVGTYAIEFNTPHLSSGVYFYELSASGSRDVKKMALIK